MKNIFTLFIVSCFGYNAFAQTTIAEGDLDNGKVLIESYLSPFGKSLGASLNNGWWNTAKPHRLGGFDITLTLNTVLIPDAGKSFNVNDVGGSSFSSNSNSTSTWVGDKTETEINYINNSLGINEIFKMPGGTELKFVPIPMLQAGIGLIKNTEIDVRYFPSMEIEEIGDISMLGIGLKHDILQWFPIVDKIPIDVSIQAGYTGLKAEMTIEEQPVNLDIKVTTVNLIASKKFAMLTGYFGLGYNSSTTTFKVEKTYKIGIEGTSINFDSGDLSEINFESQNEIRANVGLRLQLAIIAIQANYTLSEYPVATIGLGISIR